MKHIGTQARNALTTGTSPCQPSQDEWDRTRQAIMVHLRRLGSHFATNGTDKDLQVILEDYSRELSAYPLEDVVAAVNAHIRTGQYYPKLAELLAPLEVKQKRRQRIEALRAPTLELTYNAPDPETRKRDVEDWKKIRKTLPGAASDVAVEDLQKMPVKTLDDKSYDPDDVAALIEADRRIRDVS